MTILTTAGAGESWVWLNSFLGTTEQPVFRWPPELISNALTPAGLRGQTLPAELSQHIGRVKSQAMLLRDVGGFLGILALATMANHAKRRVTFTIFFVGGFLSTALAFLTLRTNGRLTCCCRWSVFLPSASWVDS